MCNPTGLRKQTDMLKTITGILIMFAGLVGLGLIGGALLIASAISAGDY